MIYFFLLIIAIGVLLISEPGKALLEFFVVWGVTIFLFLFVIGVVVVGGMYIYTFIKNQNDSNVKYTNNKTEYFQKAETTDNPFPIYNIDEQYNWYDQHNVPMAYRCYSGGNCSVQDWAYAVYNNSSDTRGANFKKISDTLKTNHKGRFPNEKCVTEYGVKICDLTFSVIKSQSDGSREVSFKANTINCLNVTNGLQSQNQGDTIIVDSDNVYCVSDLGYIYIDPTVVVNKYYNQILKKDYNLPYNVMADYKTCIWTFADGSGAVPNIQVSTNSGPSSGFNVKAFCYNGKNQVDIYSYKED